MLSFLDIVNKTDNDRIFIESSLFDKLKPDEFEYIINDLWDIILNNILIKNKKIDVLLHDKFMRTFTFAELYMQMIFWKANINYKVKIRELDFYTHQNMTSGDVHDVIEIILQRFNEHFRKHGVDKEELASIATYIIEKINNFAAIFSWIAPDSINLYDIIQFSKRNATFNKLIHTQLDDNSNTKEIEQKLSSLEKELIDCIMEDKRNCLYQYVATGTVNKAQLRQMFTAVGTRASIDKTVLSVYIKSNFLNGLQTASDFYAEALSARTALIDKSTYVADSGYAARKLDLNSLDTTINQDLEDCKTKHYLTINVRSDFILQSLNNKYQIMDDGKLRPINSNVDKHLIGQQVKIRSHALCAGGKHVCKTCFGDNADLMKNTRIGCFPSIEVESHISNMTISSKHFQITNSSDISNCSLLKFFNIEKNACYLKTELDYSNIKIVINKIFLENILENNANSESEEEYDMVPLESDAKIVETIFDKKSSEIVTKEYAINEIPSLFIFITSELLEEKKAFKITHTSDNIEIFLDKINLTTPIFNLTLLSEGTVYFLNKFVKLIDSKLIETLSGPDELINEILQILEELKIKSKIQHVETLIKGLIKDKYDTTKPPDFRKNEVELQLIPLERSIMHKDIYTSLLFEEYITQFKSLLFFKKNSDGLFDCFFKTTHKFVDFDNKKIN